MLHPSQTAQLTGDGGVQTGACEGHFTIKEFLIYIFFIWLEMQGTKQYITEAGNKP